ncbi:unnamed protein product [Linum trigynum]|uniref:Uncharacterized protein n=1 Tax=Linum trigynum TaxID=586398 RepID=A0AAV2E8W8_9ROSI
MRRVVGRRSHLVILLASLRWSKRRRWNLLLLIIKRHVSNKSNIRERWVRKVVEVPDVMGLLQKLDVHQQGLG